MTGAWAYRAAAAGAMGLALGLSLSGCGASGSSDVPIASRTFGFTQDDGKWSAEFFPRTDNAVTYTTDADGTIVEAMSTLAEGLGIGPQALYVTRVPVLGTGDRARAAGIAREVCEQQGLSARAEALAGAAFSADSGTWIFQEVCA